MTIPIVTVWGDSGSDKYSRVFTAIYTSQSVIPINTPLSWQVYSINKDDVTIEVYFTITKLPVKFSFYSDTTSTTGLTIRLLEAIPANTSITVIASPVIPIST